jgi:DNA-directed RNA polymerase subunit alpha
MIKAMKDFQIPMRVEVDKDTHSQTFGRFTTEAYERGFGTTVGNALRRVLLSSLTGAAVTTVKIEGVLHEFSTIPGITEDVTSIILNVKGLRLAVHTDRPKTLRLKKKGPGEAKGSDIIHDADVTILTPNLHIATLDKDASFDMEMTVKHGRGYVPAERNKEEGLPIGVIAIDSVFSPIKRVNFHVEKSGRMGPSRLVMLCPLRPASCVITLIFLSIPMSESKGVLILGAMRRNARSISICSVA